MMSNPEPMLKPKVPWQYQLPIDGGDAFIVFPGKPTPQGARDLLEWFAIITAQLERWAQEEAEDPALAAP